MRSTKLNVLIVHAHHEPKSFGSALFHLAVQTLSGAGHSVVTSDLYTQRFDPVSDRRNFLNPIEHGIFWFNGFLSLRPFIAFQPAPLSHDERTSYLQALGERLQHIEGEQPRTGDERSG